MSDHGTTAAFYAARPAVLIDGRTHESLSDGVLSLMVSENTDGLYRCEISFGNWGATQSGVGYLYFDRADLDFGKTISIRIGDSEAADTVFKGRIMGIEARYLRIGTPEISVLADDRLQDLRMERRTRTFENTTDRGVMSQIASEHGLGSSIDVDGPLHRVLSQVNQSDLAFLRDRARALDAELWLDNGKLRVESRGRRRHDEVRLTYGQRLHEFRVLADLAGQRSRVRVTGWDVSTKEGIEIEAGNSTLLSELRGDLGGTSVLSSAIAERTEQLVHTVPLSDAEARYRAEAVFRRLGRRFVTGEGVAEGDARIRVGTYLELVGLGPLFNGRYYVAEVRHTFNPEQGFRTQFRVERPGIGRG